MKLTLKKKQLKRLDNDKQLDNQATPQVGGAGESSPARACLPTGHICNRLSADNHYTCWC